MTPEALAAHLHDMATTFGTTIQGPNGPVPWDVVSARTTSLTDELRSAGAGYGSLVEVAEADPTAVLVGLLGGWGAGAVVRLRTPQGKAECSDGDARSAGLLVRGGTVTTELREGLADRVSDELRDWAQRGRLPADACYLATTSGSTGTARGVLGSAESLLAFCTWEVERLGLRPADRVATVTSPGFDVVYRERD